MRRVSTRVSALAAVGIVLAAAVVFACPAQASSMGNCTTTNGVVVAVSFGHWGGPVVRGCGPDGETGLTAMHDAGFTTSGTTHDGPAFVCRIASGSFKSGKAYPTASQDKCVNTPPAGAYWSYWHADRGQHSWSYSKLGAASYRPKPGSVDYWQFGATNVSGGTAKFDATPDQVRAKNTGSSGNDGSGSGHGGHGAARGSNRGSAKSGNHGVVHGAAAEPGSRSASTATSDTRSSVSGKPASSTETSSSAAISASSAHAPGAPPGSRSAEPSIVDGSPVANGAKPASSSGSAVPLIIGLTVALLIGTGAGWVVLRRRAPDVE